MVSMKSITFVVLAFVLGMVVAEIAAKEQCSHIKMPYNLRSGRQAVQVPCRKCCVGNGWEFFEVLDGTCNCTDNIWGSQPRIPYSESSKPEEVEPKEEADSSD